MGRLLAHPFPLPFTQRKKSLLGTELLSLPELWQTVARLEGGSCPLQQVKEVGMSFHARSLMQQPQWGTAASVGFLGGENGKTTLQGSG